MWISTPSFTHFLDIRPSLSNTLPTLQRICIRYTHTRLPFCLSIEKLTRLLQIGRSSEEPIDFVVADTVPGSLTKTSVNRTTSCSSNGGISRVAQSTISRFACRLLVDRDSIPSRAYVYAAGFDSSRNIFLGVSFSFQHFGDKSNKSFLFLRRKRQLNGNRTQVSMAWPRMGFFYYNLKANSRVEQLHLASGSKYL